MEEDGSGRRTTSNTGSVEQISRSYCRSQLDPDIKYLNLLLRLTRTAYLYNGCLTWYNVLLTSRVHLSVKYSQQSELRTRATVE